MNKKNEISKPWKPLSCNNGEYAIFNEITGEIKTVLFFEDGHPTSISKVKELVRELVRDILEGMRDLSKPEFNDFIPKDD